MTAPAGKRVPRWKMKQRICAYAPCAEPFTPESKAQHCCDSVCNARRIVEANREPKHQAAAS